MLSGDGCLTDSYGGDSGPNILFSLAVISGTSASVCPQKLISVESTMCSRRKRTRLINVFSTNLNVSGSERNDSSDVWPTCSIERPLS